jgi:hypothetical protein
MVNHDELSPPSSKPWPDPDDPGRCHPLFDLDPRIGVDLLPELFFVGRIRKRTVPRHHWRCNLGAEEERVRDPLSARTRLLHRESWRGGTFIHMQILLTLFRHQRARYARFR